MKHLLLVIVLIVAVSCQSNDSEWISLMNKDQWHGYGHQPIPEHWQFQDSVIVCLERNDHLQLDILTDESFDYFELQFSWNIKPKGNSGVFYHVVENEKFQGPHETGPEYQLIDDIGFPENLQDWQLTGADYAMHVPDSNKVFNGANRWNTSRIIVTPQLVTHYLNGKEILSFDPSSSDWQAKKSSGKWKDYPDYGKVKNGSIGIQDHGVGVRFKEVKIKRLSN